MTMKLVFMINLILLVGVSAFSSTALGLTPPTQKNPAHRKMVVSQHSQPPRRRRSTSLAALVGNAYLNQLEQQTIEAAGTTETGSDYAVAQQVDQGMEENIPEVKKLMKQIKEAGTAGIISFALVQLGFWSLSLAIALFGYVKMTGHFPDLTDKEELSKLGAGTLWYHAKSTFI